MGSCFSILSFMCSILSKTIVRASILFVLGIKDSHYHLGIFNLFSRYEADIAVSVFSFISNVMWCILSTQSPNIELFSERTSFILRYAVPDLNERRLKAILLGPSQSPTLTTRGRWKSAYINLSKGEDDERCLTFWNGVQLCKENYWRVMHLGRRPP